MLRLGPCSEGEGGSAFKDCSLAKAMIMIKYVETISTNKSLPGWLELTGTSWRQRVTSDSSSSSSPPSLVSTHTDDDDHLYDGDDGKLYYGDDEYTSYDGHDE